VSKSRRWRRSLVDEIADAVVARLRGTVEPHDVEISPSTRREEKCQDDETIAPVSLGRRGSKAVASGESERLTRKRMEAEADALIDSFARSRKRKSGETS
jgi:hypothetical protein